jgi:hypothetical protein
MSYPEEFGGCGFFGEDGTVEEAANALIKRFGKGCYSDDLDSQHGLYCLALATAFGIAKAEDYAILVNAYPTTAIDLITEWEAQLGLNVWEVGLTLTERWTRITARCTEIKGNNPAVLAVVFGMICGATVYVSECTAFVHGSVDRLEVAVILPIAVWGTLLWDECERVARRIEHAHGRINLCVTNDGAAPHRHPQFRSDESLTDRDCTEPH